MKETKAQVLEVRDIAEGIFLLRVYSSALADAAMPGQFLHIRVPGDQSHVLRRPISIMHIDVECGTLSMAIQIKGDGTKRLRNVKVGEKLDILGPLGRGFDAEGAKNIYFIGGGVGVAPVRCAMDAFATRESRAFFGYRTKNHVYGLENLPCEVDIVTDDGSMGEKALVTAPLLRAIEEKRPELMMACGPEPMLRAIQKIALEKDIPCLISLEEHMGCGLGACLGCTCKVKVKDGEAYKRVCMDGPVFTAEEVCFFD